jgi:hypothetical protein
VVLRVGEVSFCRRVRLSTCFGLKRLFSAAFSGSTP